MRPPNRRRRAALAALAVTGLAAGLVGFAHLRIHHLETSDVAWTAASISGDLRVVGERAYVFDGRGEGRVHDLEDGATTDVEDLPFSSSGVRIGAGGEFAVYDFDGTLAFYGADARQRWSVTAWRRGEAADVLAVSADFVTARRCTQDDGCVVEQRGENGRVVWRKKMDAARTFTDGDVPIGRDRSEVLEAPSRAVETAGGRAYPLDDDGRRIGPGIPHDAKLKVVQVGDLLVGFSHRARECRFDAARDGKPVWSTTVDCANVRPEYPDLVVGEGRLVVRYPTTTTARRSPLITLDLDSGDATNVTVDLRRSQEDTRDYWITPDAVVRRNRATISAASTTTGQRWWSESPTLRGRAAISGRVIYPAVDANGQTVASFGRYDSVWRRLALGRDVPSQLNELRDVRTGRLVARVLTPIPYSVTGIDDRRALILSDDELRLVDTS